MALALILAVCLIALWHVVQRAWLYCMRNVGYYADCSRPVGLVRDWWRKR